MLSGLLICGCCGGACTITGKNRYACATRRSKGAGSNRASDRHLERWTPMRSNGFVHEGPFFSAFHRANLGYIAKPV
jgi:hypothetical protein